MVLKFLAITLIMQLEFVGHRRLQVVGNENGVLLYRQSRRLIAVTLGLILCHLLLRLH